MKIKGLGSIVAGLAMIVTPVAASANPASSLSVLPARAGSADDHNSQLAGNGIIFAGLGLAILVAGLIVAVDNGNDHPRSP